MTDEIPSIKPVRPHPSESDLLTRMEALIHEYDGEVSAASVVGCLEYLKARVIANLPAWPGD